MDKRQAKLVISNIISILGINEEYVEFDGFYYTEKIEHNFTKERVEQLINLNVNWSPLIAYECILLPIIDLNPTRHSKASSIYYLLGGACGDEGKSKGYYEASFKQMVFAKLSTKGYPSPSKLYIRVLTRGSCCELCKHYKDGEIYEADLILTNLLGEITCCTNTKSCNASISVLTENGFNYHKKRNNN